MNDNPVFSLYSICKIKSDHDNHYDIIIIGTGVRQHNAYKLAPTGKRILILERGGFIPKEKQNWIHMSSDRRTISPNDTWLDQDDNHSNHLFTIMRAIVKCMAPRCFVFVKAILRRLIIMVHIASMAICL